MIKKILLSLSCALAISSFGAQASGKWHTSKLHTVYPTSQGGFVLTFKTNAPDCSQTVNSAHKYHYVEVNKHSMTMEGANKIYSLALMAAASNKSMSFFYDSTSDKCYINRAYVQF
ncbi:MULTISPECIES: response regulator receiver protein [Pseudoalteromonas]|uniref:Response regulator receiver protein n=1 Tax=Pseudoalteromonas rubra TaxID=43658 RepID=A0A5S3UX70_9GAMM|nr:MULTISPECIES: response regulator receiver protein [Pseudoalteromonas]MCG7561661.1 hypothetical protein [Pseudoalteromonas sp. McH1-42]MEC4089267.1 hypothetical protein [Pseudoalteromonas rubra]QPB83242.1 response regulator receiver protein [Pseudoalteromonas rubra]